MADLIGNLIINEIERFGGAIQQVSDGSRKRVLLVVSTLILLTIGLQALLFGVIFAISQITPFALWQIALTVGAALLVAGAWALARLNRQA